MKRFSLLLLLGFVLAVPCASLADNLARDYIPAPPDTLAIFTYYQHVSADSYYANGKKIAKDADYSANVGLFRPVYFTQIGPFVIDPQCIIPFGSANLKSDTLGLDMTTSGFGDPIVLATIWFLNDTKSKTWLGFTPFFFIPVGAYDNDGVVSLGENRWRFREELGFVKGFEIFPEHNLYFELQVGGDFFTTNHSYTAANLNMDQDPILNIESHLSYDVTKAFWVSADYYYHNGGKKEVDGVKLSDSTVNSHTVGMTLAYNIAPSWQLLFQYKADVYAENGLPTQTALFRFLYVTDFGSLYKCRGDAK